MEEDAKLLLTKDIRDIEYDYKINVDNLTAPLNAGDIIGKLKLTYDNESIEYNIVVNENVKKANYFETLYFYFKDVISGNVNLIKTK